MPLTPPSFKGQLYTVISRQASVGVKLFLYASWFLAQAWSQNSDLQTLVLDSWLGKPSAHMCAELGIGHSLDRQCMKVLRCRLWIQMWFKILTVLLRSYVT